MGSFAGNSGALTAQQQRGLDRFQGKGNCTKCHAGAMLSDATVSFFEASGPLNHDGGDQGFHNLGVRPTAEDLGRAGAGPVGVAYSVSGLTARAACRRPARAGSAPARDRRRRRHFALTPWVRRTSAATLSCSARSDGSLA